MKKLLFLVTLLFATVINAQNWQPVVNGVGAGGGYVQTMAVYNGELYAGGQFYGASGTPVSNIAKFNGTNWADVGGGTTGPVTAMIVYNGELYVAGNFYEAGGVPVNNLAKWNGSSWSDVNGGLNSTSVRHMTIYNGELIVVGNFTSVGTPSLPAYGIARYGAAGWDTLGQGVTPGAVTASPYNGNLYAAGTIAIAGTTPVENVAKWDGTNWSKVGLGDGLNAQVECSEVHNDTLYIGGSFTETNNQIILNHIARFNAGVGIWQPLYTGMNQDVSCLLSYGNDLYAGGFFTIAGGLVCNNIARWDGTNWNSVDGGMSAQVYALCLYDGFLYAGGDFSQAGSNTCFHIARIQVGPTGINTISQDRDIVLYPQPSNDYFVINGLKTNKAILKVFNSCGQCILTKNVVDNDRIETDFLSSGNYSVQIISDNFCVNKKLIVNK